MFVYYLNNFIKTIIVHHVYDIISILVKLPHQYLTLPFHQISYPIISFFRLLNMLLTEYPSVKMCNSERNMYVPSMENRPTQWNHLDPTASRFCPRNTSPACYQQRSPHHSHPMYGFWLCDAGLQQLWKPLWCKNYPRKDKRQFTLILPSEECHAYGWTCIQWLGL